MKILELEQDKAIEAFLKRGKHSRADLRDFFRNHFLLTGVEVEFMSRVINNVIDVSHGYYLSLSKPKRYHFLKALGKLFHVALVIKEWEHSLSMDNADRFWREMPTYFMNLVRLTEPLEAMRREISLVDKRRVHDKVVLLEGEAEFNFINVMQELTTIANLDFPTHNYQGKGNIQNLAHYIREKNRQGIKVLLTYDEDGHHESFLRKLTTQKCRLEDDFGFTKDFENSFPPQILKLALEDYVRRHCNLRLEFDVAVIRKLLKRRRPFILCFKEESGIDVSKAKLAIILGEIMINQLERHWNDIFYLRKRAFGAEIYRFLNFIIRSA